MTDFERMIKRLTLDQENLLRQVQGKPLLEIPYELKTLDEISEIKKTNLQKFVGATIASSAIKEGVIKNRIADETFNNISKINVNRGEIKGFIFENLHTKDLNYKLYKKGLKATVIDNNGISDIVIQDIKTGKVVERIQAKCGYEGLSSTKNLTKYIDDGQTLVINKDAKKFKNLLDKDNIPYETSTITNKEASKIANTMKKEGSYLNKSNANLSSNVYKTKEVVRNCHNSGISSAKSGAMFGAGVSLGSNIVEVMCGDKDLGEATVDIAKDTLVSSATGYATGAVGSALASTTVGSTVLSGASAVGSTLASSTVGTAVLSGASAVSSVASGAASAIAGTTLGGAVTTGVSAVSGALATTAVGSAVVAAAPVIAAGALIGGGFSLISKLFKD